MEREDGGGCVSSDWTQGATLVVVWSKVGGNDAQTPSTATAREDGGERMADVWR
ncbi:uncharacterized protein G2W53_000404 [Senna tora]|uniref:Uncharacterized protein n=1 Tax=Senna tora TaxID=362788 RepID=A0A834XFM8_9FABA|nr:uncharacterized protein G2W53_000404 [Senna tora]